ncbi:hypothetical protein M7I_5759 [Glarea lozoyensis 74030]|uniref:Uncharacterized protein n=1 Tax=Glarea lozoyensis (strain ATCC 74030 / MF5533) TaxID=1104152 RepID=H0ESR6_GLAL7|nr:hypothetical protein M7I_5759 [Glarea lozoyensis 74030]
MEQSEDEDEDEDDLTPLEYARQQGLSRNYLTDTNVQRVRKLRIELPLLKSHLETDLRKFARRDGFEIDLKDIKLPLELVDESAGEGMTFPDRHHELGSKIIEDLKMEKLAVSREAISFLQRAIQSSWTREDEDELWRDLEKIEREIFAQDVPTPLRKRVKVEGNGSDDSTPLKTTQEQLEEVCRPFMESATTPPTSTERFKSEKYKVEDILTPPMPKVRFSQTVEFVQPELLDEVPPPGSDEIKETLESNFGEAYKNVTQRINQEQLEQKDVTARVRIPYMPGDIPDPPWKPFRQCRTPAELLELQKEMMRLTVGTNLKTWKRPNQLELRWAPFPRAMTRVDFSEPALGDDKTWEQFLGTRETVMTSGDMTWKPPGLRILKDEDDDDELEPMEKVDNQIRQDLLSLVRKRKLELDLRDLDEQDINAVPGAKDNALLSIKKESVEGVKKRKNTPKPLISAANTGLQKLNELPEPNMLLGDEFSALDMIGNFKQLRGEKKPKPIPSNYFTQPPKNPAVSLQLNSDPAHEKDLRLPHHPSPKPLLHHKPSLPLAPLKPPTTPLHILISTLLLKNRPLIKTLHSLLPTLILIERDFSTHNTSLWLPGSVARSPVSSPLDSEADLIISPKTGLVLTTLQKIRQKVLPGSKGRNAIQERIARVRGRYEMLFVLVTGEDGVAEGDAEALCEISGFAAGGEGNVVVYFVGPEDGLARWIAHMILSYRSSEGGVLIEDETHWELFLRRAGMNAYAAQQVIAHLKAPEGVDALSPSKAGFADVQESLDEQSESELD